MDYRSTPLNLCCRAKYYLKSMEFTKTVLPQNNVAISRLTIVSHEAKEKQAVCNEQVSYLQVAPL